MITLFMSVRTHENKINEFKALAQRLTPSTRTEEGCIEYTFHQQKTDPRNFVLREQWRDRDSLDKHLKILAETLGPPREGQKLPAALFDLCEAIDVKPYDVVA